MVDWVRRKREGERGSQTGEDLSSGSSSKREGVWLHVGLEFER